VGGWFCFRFGLVCFVATRFDGSGGFARLGLRGGAVATLVRIDFKPSDISSESQPMPLRWTCSDTSLSVAALVWIDFKPAGMTFKGH
jgi:hypothetical protein